MVLGIAQITHDGQQNAFWAGNNLYVKASASQASGAAAVTTADLIAGAQSGDTPALVGAQALTLVVYNDGTSETITGLSLAATGTTASGGIGAITYAIAEDVGGNPISIASGSSQTFFILLDKGMLETFKLTPTFGAAPAAGSIETLTTVHTNPAAVTTMSLAGSNPPLTSPPARLLCTATYTDFTANNAYFVNFTGLTPYARGRTFWVVNTMDESISNGGFFPSDSNVNYEGALNAGTGTLNMPTANNYVMTNSDVVPELGAQIDAGSIALGMGSTLPTKGNVYILVRELI